MKDRKEFRVKVLQLHYDISGGSSSQPVLRTVVAEKLELDNHNDLKLLAAIRYLNDKGFLKVHTNVEDVITAKGIDEVESGFQNFKETTSTTNDKSNQVSITGSKNNVLVGQGHQTTHISNATHNSIASLKDLPLWLRYVVAAVTIFSVFWAVYIYYSPSTDIVEDDNGSNENLDLRNTLVGYDSVFDLVSEIHSTDLEIDRKDLADENLSKSFKATSTMLELGEFDNGNLWVTMKGIDSRGDAQVMECHFDGSWESTLRNLFNTEKKQIEFKGEIAFYKQYWLVAEDCEVVNY